MTTKSKGEGIPQEPADSSLPPWELVTEDCPYRQMIVGGGGRHPFIAKRCASWRCRRCAARRRLLGWWADCFARAGTVYVASEDLDQRTWQQRREEAVDEVAFLLSLNAEARRLRNNLKSRLNARVASFVRLLGYRDDGQVTLTYWADRDLSNEASGSFKEWRPMPAEDAIALFVELTAPGRPVDTKRSTSSDAGTEFRPSPLREARIDGGGDWRHTRELRGPDGAVLSQEESRVIQRLTRNGWTTTPGDAVVGETGEPEFIDVPAGRVAEELPPSVRPDEFTRRVDTVAKLQGQPGVEYVETRDPVSGRVVKRELRSREGMAPADTGGAVRQQARDAWRKHHEE